MNCALKKRSAIHYSQFLLLTSESCLLHLKISLRGGRSPNFGSSIPIAFKMVGAISVIRIVCKSVPALMSGPHAINEDSSSWRNGKYPCVPIVVFPFASKLPPRPYRKRSRPVLPAPSVRQGPHLILSKLRGRGQPTANLGHAGASRLRLPRSEGPPIPANK